MVRLSNEHHTCETVSIDIRCTEQAQSERWTGWITHSISQLQQFHLQRHLRPLPPSKSAVEVAVGAQQLQDWASALDGNRRPVLDDPDQVVQLKLFSLNDYLGLSTHPKVGKAIAHAAEAVGTGPRSSALVGGFTTLHRQLEVELAQLKGTEDCLLFPSGFAANTAVLASLGSSPDCAIFSDALNHASIIDGCRLAVRSGAQLVVYRHCDLSHLEQQLQAASHRRKLVVTDSLFSMDGDFADLPELVRLKQKHGFLLVIDEAHATLICGSGGGGAAEAAGVSGQVDVHVGTLSKAAGSHGGFAACSAAVRSLLLNKGRSFVFSTALPIPIVSGALAALRIACHEEPWRRRHLQMLTRQLSQRLSIPACSPIIPVMLGSEQHAVAASAALLLKGFHVPAIRPPTVPSGTSRLRVSLSAAHTSEEVDKLAIAILEVVSDLDLVLEADTICAKL